MALSRRKMAGGFGCGCLTVVAVLVLLADRRFGPETGKYPLARDKAEARLGLTFPADARVHARAELVPGGPFCMAESQMTPGQFRQFAKQNHLVWRRASMRDDAVVWVREGSHMSPKMRLWHPASDQKLLVDDQRSFVASATSGGRWVRKGHERPDESECDSEVVLAYEVAAGSMVVLCFVWG